MAMKMKRLFGFLLTMAMVLNLLPGMMMTAKAAEIVIDSSIKGWEGNTYVLNGNVTITDRIAVTGEAKLVLNAGCTLTASKGITVAKGNKLIIEGSGTLIASTKVEGTANIAGIGGVANQDCGTVIINGGNIIANKEKGGQAAGIGGGLGNTNGGNGGTIIINGGKVTAKGAGGGAGIGGGPGKSAVSITITGGEINAVGSAYSAAIGGGSDGSCGEINISGGKINAEGIAGPGIGSGRNAGQEGINRINITGGEITAVASDKNNHDEAIGKGGSSKDVTVTIGSGVTVFSSNTAITDVKQVPENMKTMGPCQNVTGRAHYMTVKKMDKAKVSTPPRAVSDLIYTGLAQELVTAGTASGGTLQYAVGTSATTAPASGWNTAIPTGTGVGTCYVWYKAKGDANHFDSDPLPIEVRIETPQLPAPQPQTEAPQSQTEAASPEAAEEPITIQKAPARAKVKAKKNSITVSWNKIKKSKKTKALRAQIKNIEVQYSTDSSFPKEATNSRIIGKNRTKLVLRGLTGKTIYYIRFRYVSTDGVSNWNTKRVRTK